MLMMTNDQIKAVLPDFRQLPFPREGHLLTFRGNVPDDSGEPTGAYVEIQLIVPPPNFTVLQRMQARANARTAPATPAELQADTLDTVHGALRRNYLAVPRWLVEQTLDVPTIEAIFQTFAAMRTAGVKRATEAAEA
jgi:hypothetical protein